MHYLLLVVQRAWLGTRPQLGVVALVIAVVFTVATSVALGGHGSALTLVLRTTGVVVVCYAAAVLLIFLVSLVRAPGAIHAEQERKIQALEQHRDAQAVLDQLAEFRQDLINLEALGQSIKTAEDLIPWITEISRLIRATGEYLEAHVSKAARNRFDALGHLEALEVFGLNDSHYQHAVMLVHYQRNLEALMDRFATETGTSC